LRFSRLNSSTFTTAIAARLHRGVNTAATAEILMRAWYVAFAVGEPDYLMRTWHASTRPETVELTRSSTACA
jgi:SEC-C motif-containing protein